MFCLGCSLCAVSTRVCDVTLQDINVVRSLICKQLDFYYDGSKLALFYICWCWMPFAINPPTLTMLLDLVAVLDGLLYSISGNHLQTVSFGCWYLQLCSCLRRTLTILKPFLWYRRIQFSTVILYVEPYQMLLIDLLNISTSTRSLLFSALARSS